ncbi:hypothetical protein [Roseimaritima sediminicola]|uniref:hypothetical protein n=1 Tax=Roseimaritima sediminicola TaxID=2662066 RepID=UPI0012984377|nr:hypothetical protein [Roseimaritima sediminicola]
MRLYWNSTFAALVLLGVLMGSSAPARAQNDFDALFGARRTCDHVIDLLLRYGNGSDGYQGGGGVIRGTAYGPAVVPHDEIGDLELISITLVNAGGVDCGPTVAVAVRNNSGRDVCDFRISLVAVLHRIHPLCPTTVHRVEKICAGQTAEFQIVLPAAALSMGRAGEQVLCWQKLVVAIDSYDQLLECNEANNLKVVNVSAIPRAVVEQVVGESVDEPADGAGPEASVPSAGTPGDQPAPTPTSPDAESPGGLDGLDFDNLDLGEATAAVARPY